MTDSARTGMARGRGLITEAERKHIAGKGEDQQRQYEAISRVRARINEELCAEVQLLKEHHPELLEDLQEVVCENDD